jgi:hypothetical protein
MDDGAIVLGTIELGTKTVTLSVNSAARAARGRAMLEARWLVQADAKALYLQPRRRGLW